jgi:very-short-patch-repair endonuclease
MPDWKPRDIERARELRNRATPAERPLWRFISNSQIGYKFNRQMQIGSFLADFLCLSHRPVIELDGFSHDIDPDRDIWRDKFLKDVGYHVLHFRNEEVLTNVEGVVTMIRLALGDRLTPNPSRKREGGSGAPTRKAER